MSHIGLRGEHRELREPEEEKAGGAGRDADQNEPEEEGIAWRNTRFVNLNGSAGAFVAVSATQVTRRVEIIEDGSANAGTGQGLAYQFNDGSATPFVTVYTIEPQSEPIISGLADPAGCRLCAGGRHAAGRIRRLHDCGYVADQSQVGEREQHHCARHGVRLMRSLALLCLMIASTAMAQQTGGGGVPGGPGSSSLPTATAAGQVPTATGAGTAYTAQFTSPAGKTLYLANYLANPSIPAQARWDCSWSISSSPATITCPSGTFTPAMTGWVAWATQLTPGGNASVANNFACGAAGTNPTLTYVSFDLGHDQRGLHCCLFWWIIGRRLYVCLWPRRDFRSRYMDYSRGKRLRHRSLAFGDRIN